MRRMATIWNKTSKDKRKKWTKTKKKRNKNKRKTKILRNNYRKWMKSWITNFGTMTLNNKKTKRRRTANSKIWITKVIRKRNKKRELSNRKKKKKISVT